MASREAGEKRDSAARRRRGDQIRNECSRMRCGGAPEGGVLRPVRGVERSSGRATISTGKSAGAAASAIAIPASCRSDVQCARQTLRIGAAPPGAEAQSAQASSDVIACAIAPRSIEHAAKAMLAWLKTRSPMSSRATRRLITHVMKKRNSTFWFRSSTFQGKVYLGCLRWPGLNSRNSPSR